MGAHPPNTGGGGGPTLLALTDLTDVDTTGQLPGQVLTTVDGLVWTPENLPGSSPSGLVASISPEEIDATVGDAVQTATGLSIPLNGNTLTFTGAVFSNYPNNSVGRLVYGKFGPGGTPRVVQVKAFVSNTQVTLCPVGNPTGTYLAQAAVTAGGGCHYAQSTSSPGRAADMVAWEAALVSAKTTGLPITGRPLKRYAFDRSLDLSNTHAFRAYAIGGRPFIDNNFNVQAAGCVIYTCSETPIVAFMGANTAISHNGIRVENFGCTDPAQSFTHGFYMAQYQTRWRCQGNVWVGMAKGCQIRSGSKDVSWGYAIDNTWINNTVSFDMFNQTPDAGLPAPGFNGGAMANGISGGDGHVYANQTGIIWWGGQYGDVTLDKLDMDGVNCKFMVLKGQDSVTGLGADGKAIPSAGLITIHDIHVEAGTTNAFDSESIFVDITGGVSNVTIRDCFVGGGGAAAAGSTVRMIGTSATQRVENIRIEGGSSRAREWAIIFGNWTRNCKVDNHNFISAGGNAGGFIRVDAGSLQCTSRGCIMDGTSNPLANPAKILIDPGSTGFYIQDYSWATGRATTPLFAGAPPSYFGQVGDRAYNVTSDLPFVKASTGWVVSGASQSRIVGMSKSGALPAADGDTADFAAPTLGAISLTSMTVTVETPPAGAMQIRLRRSTDGGVTFANVTGFLATFVAGAHTATVTASAVVVNLGDLLNFTIVGAGTGAADVTVYVQGVTP